MIACVQRVSKASVTVDGLIVGQIEAGLLVLLGVGESDGQPQADKLAQKIVGLRIFEDEDGKMNRSVTDSGGSILVVSQFTLLGDCRKGRRPSFVKAARPELANELYEYFTKVVSQLGVSVATGKFQAHMDVELINDGPVTLLLNTDEWNV